MGLPVVPRVLSNKKKVRIAKKGEAIAACGGIVGVKVKILSAFHGRNTAGKKSSLFIVKRLLRVKDPQNCKRLHYKTGLNIQILFNRLRKPGRQLKLLKYK